MTHDNLQSKGGPMRPGDGAKLSALDRARLSEDRVKVPGAPIVMVPPGAKMEPVSILDRVNQILGGK